MLRPGANRVVTPRRRNDDLCGDGLCEEGLATSAGFFYIWIVEDKFCAEAVLLPVHLAADDAEERLAVDEDFYAVLLDALVEATCLLRLDVLEVVGHAGAALVADADADHLGARVGVHECAESKHGGGSELESGGAGAKLGAAI